MRRHSLRLLFCLSLMALINLPIASVANAQSLIYPPYELYKFHMGSTNGYFYTPWYSQGANAAGYTFQGLVPSTNFSTSIGSGIYPNPQNGYTPTPSSGLTPLYQWWVVQGFRSYTYLTIYPGGGGSGYTLSGIMGYVYPPSTTVDSFGLPTRKISAWYSQSRGYWYGLNEPSDLTYEGPPNSTYVWQGVAFRLPATSRATSYPLRCLALFFCNDGLSVQYDPPPPPPECDPYQEQSCYNSGGWWDSGSCTCNY